MGQFDIPLSMPGGFKSLADAKAHRNVVSKLTENRDLAVETAGDMREIDEVDISSTPSDLYKDLAAGKGHVILLSQPEGSPLLGAELNYNPADESTRQLVMDLDSSKLTQVGSTFKIEEGAGPAKTTTYFKFDDKRGVVSVLDTEHDVPAIFGEANPQTIIGGTLQGGIPILVF